MLSVKLRRIASVCCLLNKSLIGALFLHTSFFVGLGGKWPFVWGVGGDLEGPCAPVSSFEANKGFQISIQTADENKLPPATASLIILSISQFKKENLRQ